uniref:interleukin-13 receptor subunit alpha-2 isoform X1 n=1 Tax=Doryrhamphus excisus TaxID=161450 RepID=UPI0025AE28F4|nr:interleukin-13 receptor subunit alpha-2 isoform X1 [Doryrhamphus excisus]
MMSSKVVLLAIILRCGGIQVDPPEEIKIIDSGHLGHLEMTWTPPASLIHMQECLIRYQLEYYNTYRQSWTVIKTIHRTYSDQFDLMKDVQVRVYTLLSGPCTNNTWIRSANYTEVVQNPPSTGLQDSEVEDFGCVFHNMEKTICMWKKSSKSPTSSQLYLYYWYTELEKTEECPDYITKNGVRRGCNFTEKPLPDFTDVNFCVNGSSPEGPLKPTYMSIQIQNYVKPARSDKPHLQTLKGAPLKLHWMKPHGKIPGRCLEYEVEHTRVDPDGKHELQRIPTMLTNHMFPPAGNNERNCFKVRSKLNKYCAMGSFWSAWSHTTCH